MRTFWTLFFGVATAFFIRLPKVICINNVHRLIIPEIPKFRIKSGQVATPVSSINTNTYIVQVFAFFLGCLRNPAQNSPVFSGVWNVCMAIVIFLPNNTISYIFPENLVE